jgi:hypothetical protein
MYFHQFLARGEMALHATLQSNSFTLFRDVIQLRELSVMLAAPVVPEWG